MKFCKYCGSEMISEEFETNKHNSHRYKVYYTCMNCHAICDAEYIDNKNEHTTISETWWNPTTKELEK